MSDYEPDDVETVLATTGTNTNPFSQIGIINKETKKKPYDVKIKNNNPNEPKIFPNMKYSDKQRYRRYKTKTEPKLFNKIMIDEEDDIVNTIKKAFGIEIKPKRNYSDVETSGMPYYEEPNPRNGDQPPQQPREQQPEQPEQPEQQQPSPQRKQQQPSPQREQQPREQPSTSTEITSEIASPGPQSPKVLMRMLENRTKPRLPEDAEKSQQRLEKLAEFAKTKAAEEQAKRDKILKAPLSEENEKKLQAHLNKNFVELTEQEIKKLRGQYQRSGYLPDVDTFGRTAEDRKRINTELTVTEAKIAFGGSKK